MEGVDRRARHAAAVHWRRVYKFAAVGPMQRHGPRGLALELLDSNDERLSVMHLSLVVSPTVAVN